MLKLIEHKEIPVAAAQNFSLVVPEEGRLRQISTLSMEAPNMDPRRK